MKPKESFIRLIGALCLTFACLALSVWLLFTSNSFAGEAKIGLAEISQEDVPLVITKPGSYCLISNLEVSSPDVSAITNNADNVTIDLNGFTISGPGKGVSGIGIKNDMMRGVFNVVVRNGTVRGWGIGIHLHGSNNRVENVRVFEAGSEIFVGSSSVVSQCQVAFAYNGIGTDDGSMVLNNTINSMEGRCINTSGDSPGPVGGVIVIGNNCRLSPIGIRVVGQGNRIEGNTITQYSDIGIDLSLGSNNYFAKNLLQDNGTPGAKPWVDDSDDINGDFYDPALSNIILPSYVP
jgi:parallel beta-helix repeat protein